MAFSPSDHQWIKYQVSLDANETVTIPGICLNAGDDLYVWAESGSTITFIADGIKITTSTGIVERGVWGARSDAAATWRRVYEAATGKESVLTLRITNRGGVAKTYSVAIDVSVTL